VPPSLYYLEHFDYALDSFLILSLLSGHR